MSVAALTFAIVAASPLAAQSANSDVSTNNSGTMGQRVNQQPRTVIVPGYGTVYVVPQQPKDTRTPRQRCVDEEIEREGGSPSRLAMGAIDLKCSQR